jgi:hypothetical protein
MGEAGGCPLLAIRPLPFLSQQPGRISGLRRYAVRASQVTRSHQGLRIVEKGR